MWVETQIDGLRIWTNILIKHKKKMQKIFFSVRMLLFFKEYLGAEIQSVPKHHKFLHVF